MATLPNTSRRAFVAAFAAAGVSPFLGAATTRPNTGAVEPIIDIHQHTHYGGRTDEQLIAHQARMGVARTILLPAGSVVARQSTHDGKSNGLAARCGGNETVAALAQKHPERFMYFANEVADLPGAADEITRCLKGGAIGVGEQKFNVDCDSAEICALAEVAAEYQVPVLLHFQYETYNKGFERFHRVLEKYPKVNFIGHAQTFWANIDKGHVDQKVLYPKTKVTPGGLTDRYLADYPNLHADLSAGSGLNSLLRDEDQAREFLARHQDKILYGSDCNDLIGRGPVCTGWLAINAVRRLAPGKMIERKILYENAKRLFKL
jgi:predicted TIM-barrel fold metal-dependent hydrolase